MNPLLLLQGLAGNAAVSAILGGNDQSGTIARRLLVNSPVAIQRQQEGSRSETPGNEAMLALFAGTVTPPRVTEHSHPDEQASETLASEVMSKSEPGGQPAAAPRVPGGLDPDTRSFFESRFGTDLGHVRVHTDARAAESAARFGAAAYTLGADLVMGSGQQAGPNLVTAHELAHVVRGDAVGRICRAPEGSEGFKIISQVWRVADRDIVIVATGYGDQVLFFYRRTGLGNKGVGVAVEPGKWAPFKTLMEHPKVMHPDPRIAEKAAGEAWFNKNPYYTNVGPEDPLRGYGNTRNQEVGGWLDRQEIPAAVEAESWEKVEQEMDQVAARYRASTPGGGPSGGGAPGGSIESKAGSAESKGAGTEVKAAGAEAEAVAMEAKAAGGEAQAAKLAQEAATAGRAARLGGLLLELGLPGPWDVLFLYLAAFASIAEAKAKLKADAYALGFAEGLSAVLTGTSASKATDLLMFKVADPSMGERVLGWEGVRERGTNEGVAAGFKFGQALDPEQHTGFLAKCFADIGARGQTIVGDFGRDDLITMGVALRPTVIELLEEAERQEQARRAEKARRRGQFPHRGWAAS